MVLAHGADPVGLRLERSHPVGRNHPQWSCDAVGRQSISALTLGADPASPTKPTSTNIHSDSRHHRLRGTPTVVGARPPPSRPARECRRPPLRAKEFAKVTAPPWQRFFPGLAPTPACHEHPPSGPRLRAQVAAQSALARRCFVRLDPPASTDSPERHKPNSRRRGRTSAARPLRRSTVRPLCRPWRQVGIPTDCGWPQARTRRWDDKIAHRAPRLMGSRQRQPGPLAIPTI
jgi:hypothetical protein